MVQMMPETAIQTHFTTQTGESVVQQQTDRQTDRHVYYCLY